MDSQTSPNTWRRVSPRDRGRTPSPLFFFSLLYVNPATLLQYQSHKKQQKRMRHFHPIYPICWLSIFERHSVMNDVLYSTSIRFTVLHPPNNHRATVRSQDEYPTYFFAVKTTTSQKSWFVRLKYSNVVNQYRIFKQIGNKKQSGQKSARKVTSCGARMVPRQ